MDNATCGDPQGCFLIAYEEYLNRARSYIDLPEAFGMCPTVDPPHKRRPLALSPAPGDINEALPQEKFAPPKV